MDPLEAGQQVLEGIRRNDLYILSHPEFIPVVRQRVTLMLKSFSNKPVPKGRRIATAAITPDIYAAELAKKAAAGRKKTRKPAPKKKAAVRKVRPKKSSRAKPRPAPRRRR
jgi:hypothetical protein